MSLHYPIQKRPQIDEFAFETHLGAIYEVYFYSSKGYFPENKTITDFVKIFGFYAPNRIKSFDPMVSNTIVKIVTDYFELYPQAVLLFAYDPAEGKEGSRKRLFKRWFEAYATQDFHKVDLKVEGVVYASAIFLAEHIHRKEILGLLDDLTDSVESK